MQVHTIEGAAVEKSQKLTLENNLFPCFVAGATKHLSFDSYTACTAGGSYPHSSGKGFPRATSCTQCFRFEKSDYAVHRKEDEHHYPGPFVCAQ